MPEAVNAHLIAHPILSARLSQAGRFLPQDRKRQIRATDAKRCLAFGTLASVYLEIGSWLGMCARQRPVMVAAGNYWGALTSPSQGFGFFHIGKWPVRHSGKPYAKRLPTQRLAANQIHRPSCTALRVRPGSVFDSRESHFGLRTGMSSLYGLDEVRSTLRALGACPNNAIRTFSMTFDGIVVEARRFWLASLPVSSLATALRTDSARQA